MNVMKIKKIVLIKCVMLLLISNVTHTKEYNNLFQVLVPLSNVSDVESSIRKSFDIMIYRLSGNKSRSNIWKILNDNSTRKEFVDNYTIRNINSKTFLEVNFNKIKLESKFIKHEIPIVGISRPVILVKVKIDTGNTPAYLVSLDKQRTDFEIKLSLMLKKIKNERGIFIETPFEDLEEIEIIRNSGKINFIANNIVDKYLIDNLISIDVNNIGLNEWIISGDINHKITKQRFDDELLNLIEKLINKRLDKFMNPQLIREKDFKLNLYVKELNDIHDYDDFKNEINKIIGLRNFDIIYFVNNQLRTELTLAGSTSFFVEQINDMNSFIIQESSSNNITVVKR